MKKGKDGVKDVQSRPDCEIEDIPNKLKILVDAKHYQSKSCPDTSDILKDMKCRDQDGYFRTTGLLVFS